jgi:hypothetical protein
MARPGRLRTMSRSSWNVGDGRSRCDVQASGLLGVGLHAGEVDLDAGRLHDHHVATRDRESWTPAIRFSKRDHAMGRLGLEPRTLGLKSRSNVSVGLARTEKVLRCDRFLDREAAGRFGRSRSVLLPPCGRPAQTPTVPRKRSCDVAAPQLRQSSPARTRPVWKAMTTSWARSCAPSFIIARLTWVLAVSGET